MKRDLQAMRYILQQLESLESPNKALALPMIRKDFLDLFGTNPEDSSNFDHAFKLLKEEKFIHATIEAWGMPEGAQQLDTLKGITWRGYNLIDAIDQKRPLDNI